MRLITACNAEWQCRERASVDQALNLPITQGSHTESHLCKGLRYSWKVMCIMQWVRQRMFLWFHFNCKEPCLLRPVQIFCLLFNFLLKWQIAHSLSWDWGSGLFCHLLRQTLIWGAESSCHPHSLILCFWTIALWDFPVERGSCDTCPAYRHIHHCSKHAVFWTTTSMKYIIFHTFLSNRVYFLKTLYVTVCHSNTSVSSIWFRCMKIYQYDNLM